MHRKGIGIRGSNRLIAAILIVWAVVAAALFVAVFAPAGIIDHYMFRQTQVATVIRELTRDGPYFIYRMPLFGPPWSVPLEFPLFQILAAKLSGATGLDFVHAARLISLASMAAVLLTTWRTLVIAGAGHTLRLAAVFGLALSPALFYWSFSVMIETFAVALSAGALLCAVEYLRRRRLWLVGIGALLAIAAALAKVTTFAIFAFAIFVMFAIEFFAFAWRSRKPGQIVEFGLKRFSYGLALLLPAIVIGLAWVGFSDHIKSQSPLTERLTSHALTNWNFGDASDRLANLSYLVTAFRGNFPSIFTQFLGVLWPIPVLLAVFGFGLRPTRNVALKIVALAGFLFGPMVFANLHEIHYYYWVAGTGFLFILIAAGIDDLADFLKGASFPGALQAQWVKIGVPVVLALAVFTGCAYTFSTFFIDRTMNQFRGPPAVGEMVRAHTAPDDVVMIFGQGWDPSLQFLSDRPAVMAWQENLALEFVAEGNVEIDALLFCQSARDRIESLLQTDALRSSTWQQTAEIAFCQLYQKT